MGNNNLENSTGSGPDFVDNNTYSRRIIPELLFYDEDEGDEESEPVDKSEVRVVPESLGKSVSELMLHQYEIPGKGESHHATFTLKPNQTWKNEIGEELTIKEIIQGNDYRFSVLFEEEAEPVTGSRENIAVIFSRFEPFSGPDTGRKNFLIDADGKREVPKNMFVGRSGGESLAEKSLPKEETQNITIDKVLPANADEGRTQETTREELNQNVNNQQELIDKQVSDLFSEDEKLDFPSLLIEFQGQIDRHNKIREGLEKDEQDLGELKVQARELRQDPRTPVNTVKRTLLKIDDLEDSIEIKNIQIQEKEELLKNILEKILSDASSNQEMESVFEYINKSNDIRLKEILLNQHTREIVKRNIKRLKRVSVDDKDGGSVAPEKIEGVPSNKLEIDGQAVRVDNPGTAEMNLQEETPGVTYERVDALDTGLHSGEASNPDFEYGLGTSPVGDVAPTKPAKILATSPNDGDLDPNLIQNSTKSNELVPSTPGPAVLSMETKEEKNPPEEKKQPITDILRISPNGEVQTEKPAQQTEISVASNDLAARRRNFDNIVDKIRNRVKNGSANTPIETTVNDFFESNKDAKPTPQVSLQSSSTTKTAERPTVQEATSTQQPVLETPVQTAIPEEVTATPQQATTEASKPLPTTEGETTGEPINKAQTTEAREIIAPETPQVAVPGVEQQQPKVEVPTALNTNGSNQKKDGGSALTRALNGILGLSKKRNNATSADARGLEAARQEVLDTNKQK